MRKIGKIIVPLCLTILGFVSCNDLLDVDSERLVFQNEYQMTSKNDTLYSMFGIYSQLQKLTNSYVLLGELRGDLMDVTSNSGIYLKQINDFNVTSDNPFTNNIKDYYSVINNCNYVINTIDTSVIYKSQKVMYRVYAAAKAVRAWTYMQIVLNYGSAVYYDKPILSLEVARKAYNSYDINGIVPLLIADLTPYKDIEKPKFGSIYDFNMSLATFPIRFILGDLYLWTGKYEQAANEYHDLMVKNSNYITSTFKSYLSVVNNAFTGDATVNWFNIFYVANNSELITALPASNEFSYVFQVDSLAKEYKIAVSSVAKNNWISQHYVYSNTVDTLVDMRWVGSYYKNNITQGRVTTENDMIYKYRLMNPTTTKSKQIYIYRSALLYLRYAEAVNRLGKPNLALAVMKNGLSNATILNNKFVPLSEKQIPLPNYMDFSDNRFVNNIGTKARGLGNVQLDTTFYRIPNYATSADPKGDSILYVENMLVDELAHEMAFEGNRFQDLMRIAIRRDDNKFLADKVAAKNPAVFNKLMTRANWFLK